MSEFERFKKYVILHSNDIHGDFLPDEDPINNTIHGGLSLLSGFLNKIRSEEKNVIFTISGDIVQGSLIDSEYKGISTIEIVNYLSPSVITLGNHELDYGLPHLFFLEKIANFPIVNANLFIKKYNRRLFQPYFILNMDGFDILFIGIITEDVLQSIRLDREIGTFVDIADAVVEVGNICDAYKNDDIDLTILLTHIGHEKDKELASLLNPEWGVDLILGGHSHTFLEKPDFINNILIAQAGSGTDQIGRFDIIVDDETNSIVEWDWELAKIDNRSSCIDNDLQEFIDTYQLSLDNKFNSIICRLQKKLFHPFREYETSLGNFIADIFQDISDCDVVLIGSGSIRSDEFGPIVTKGRIRELIPYDDCMYRFSIVGHDLIRIFAHIMRNENCHHDGECFQVSRNVQAIFNRERNTLTEIKIQGVNVAADGVYKIAMQGYHYENCEHNLSVTKQQLEYLAGRRTIVSSIPLIIEEYLRNNKNIECPEVCGRMKFL